MTRSRLLFLAVGVAGLLAACAPSPTRQPAGAAPTTEAGPPPAEAGVARDAVRLRLAGFAGGRGFTLPETGVTYPLASDPKGQAGAKLGVASLPATVFIGADGTVRGRHLGAMTAEDLRAAIQRYLEVSIP